VNKAKGKTWIFNIKITNRDFNNYLKQRGPCDGCNVARIKGMANQKRFPTSNNNTSLTQIHSDIFYTHGRVPWAVCVDALSGLVTVFSLKTKNKSHMLAKCIQPLISIFASRNITIDSFFSDDEAIYVSLNEELKNMKILPVQCAPGEHDSISERNIQTIKKKAMSIMESLGYSIRSFMLPYLLRWVADTMNIIPDGDGNSPFSTIYKYHISSDLLKLPFGAICIFKNPYPTNLLNNIQKGIVLGRKLASVDSLIVYLFETSTIVARSSNSSEIMSAEGRKREIEKWLPDTQITINNNNNNNNNKIKKLARPDLSRLSLDRDSSVDTYMITIRNSLDNFRNDISTFTFNGQDYLDLT
jgi:hypothetical protein